ncbi:MAG TPA: single-stranded DNA-binding protein [Sporichthya sp.]|jgi:single-strand DNA-binding protein|nr:single-stranded DNA-binding protein [Sporichthya sp.]
MNETYVTVFGNVVEDPGQRSHVAPVKFRLASTPAWQADDGTWRDNDTNFFDVICWRKLGQHVRECVRRGDPVMVNGKLSIREWENEKGQRGRSVEIEATSVGFDLRRRQAYSQRPARSVPEWPAPELRAAEETQVTAREAEDTAAEPAA